MKVISNISVYHNMMEDNKIYGYASPLTRLLCYFVDVTIFATFVQILSIISIFLTTLLSSSSSLGGNTLGNTILISWIFSIYHFIVRPYLVNGQSFGKECLKLKIVDSHWGDPSIVTLAIRELIGKPLCFLTLGFGFFISVLRKDKRGLHDLIAGTYVIEYKK